MPDPTKTYQVRAKKTDDLDLWTTKELRAAIHVPVKVQEPPNPFAYEAAYYCGNQDCVARRITVKIQLLDGEACAPEMFCPACRHPLGSRTHCLDSVTLLPVKV